MSFVIQLIIWLIIGGCSFTACVAGVAAEWTVFWCIYGGLIVNLIGNILNSFNK